MINDKAFLLAIRDRLESAGIRAWVFGGWAEELWGMIPLASPAALRAYREQHDSVEASYLAYLRLK